MAQATQTLTCEECGRDIPRGRATIRTTLTDDPMPRTVSVAWCRICRPVFIPIQRRAS